VSPEVESVIGRGTPAWDGDGAEGVVFNVSTPDDLMSLMDLEESEVIILIHTAGASMLAPLFSDLTGIICTTGGPGSHVAILSREFGVPCLVDARLESEIVGRRVRLTRHGAIRLVSGESQQSELPIKS
jgi:phosphoenolpyruvate-protein kinase (PTS system EI component)